MPIKELDDIPEIKVKTVYNGYVLIELFTIKSDGKYVNDFLVIVHIFSAES